MRVKTHIETSGKPDQPLNWAVEGLVAEGPGRRPDGELGNKGVSLFAA
jgi:hypothetical protein